MPTKHLPFYLLTFAFSLSSFAQRPTPYPVFLTPQFERAVAAGTRTTNGLPGEQYWANTAQYQIKASLDPATAVLSGSSTITYKNNAPDALPAIHLHLRQNLHKEGAVRNRPQKLTGGMRVSDVSVNGTPLTAGRTRTGPGYQISGTIMQLQLPDALASNGEVEISINWEFKVPEAGAPRMGQDGEVFFLAYWYPQIAIYDDLQGWNTDQYMGNGEFYMDFASYDVEIAVPAGWIVGATGTLQNDETILTKAVQKRLAAAAGSSETVHIVTAEEREAGAYPTIETQNPVTWHFNADRVRDFAFGTSDKYVWDATTADVGDLDGDKKADKSMIHAFYRPGNSTWKRSAEFGQFSIEFMSDRYFPYPYPHMTAVEGVVGGGMEFPMMTHIGGGRSDQSLFGVTFHEIAHMWFPMIVAQNEKSYTWMDEGLTSFNTADARQSFWNDETQWHPDRQSYYRIAGTGREVESMRHADQYPYGTPARGIASYNKPAVALHALRGIVGEQNFDNALRTYAERWKWKHPTPYDLFNTFEDILDQDLDWFWTPMFFETWTLDQGIKAVEQNTDGVFVTIEDKGLTPMPLSLRVTFVDGTIEEKTIPVDHWLAGARESTVSFTPGNIKHIEIDPEMYLPDVDRSNNVWPVDSVK